MAKDSQHAHDRNDSGSGNETRSRVVQEYLRLEKEQEELLNEKIGGIADKERLLEINGLLKKNERKRKQLKENPEIQLLIEKEMNRQESDSMAAGMNPEEGETHDEVEALKQKINALYERKKELTMKIQEKQNQLARHTKTQISEEVQSILNEHPREKVKVMQQLSLEEGAVEWLQEEIERLQGEVRELEAELGRLNVEFMSALKKAIKEKYEALRQTFLDTDSDDENDKKVLDAIKEWAEEWKLNPDTVRTYFREYHTGVLKEVEREVTKGLENAPQTVMKSTEVQERQGTVDAVMKEREFLEQNRKLLELLDTEVRELEAITGADQARAQEVAALIEGILARDTRDPEHPTHEVRIEKDGFKDRTLQEGIPVDEAMELLEANGKGMLANTLKEKSKSYWHWHYTKETSSEVDWTNEKNKDDQHLYTEREAYLLWEAAGRKGNPTGYYTEAMARLEKRREIRLEKWKETVTAFVSPTPVVVPPIAVTPTESPERHGSMQERLRYDTNLAKIRKQMEGKTPEELEKAINQAVFAEVPEILKSEEQDVKKLRAELEKMTKEGLAGAKKAEEQDAAIKKVVEITGLSETEVKALYNREENSIKNFAKENVDKAKSKWRIVRRIVYGVGTAAVGFFVPPLLIAAGISLTVANIAESIATGKVDKKRQDEEEKKIRELIKTSPQEAQKYVRDLVNMVATEKQRQIDGKTRDVETALNEKRNAYIEEVKKNKGRVDRASVSYREYEQTLKAKESEYLKDALTYIEKCCAEV